MSSSNRIIRIANNQICISSNYYFIFEETNLPTSSFAFKALNDFYWQIEILSFDKQKKILTVTVSDYTPLDTSPFEAQEVKSHIDMLRFVDLDWQKLEPFLSLYRKNDLKYLLKEK